MRNRNSNKKRILHKTSTSTYRRSDSGEKKKRTTSERNHKTIKPEKKKKRGELTAPFTHFIRAVNTNSSWDQKTGKKTPPHNKNNSSW